MLSPNIQSQGLYTLENLAGTVYEAATCGTTLSRSERKLELEGSSLASLVTSFEGALGDAVNPDGSLKDARDIKWFHSPSDETGSDSATGSANYVCTACKKQRKRFLFVTRHLLTAECRNVCSEM